MSPAKDASLPTLPVKGDASPMTKYEQIARVHKQIVEAKWRAKTVNQPIQISPKLVIHCEESITFLAEELLKLRTMVESATAGDGRKDPI